MQFYKMHSLGNDFVVFGSPSRTDLPNKELIKELCDRHYGVGADCAVFIGNSDKHDYFMHVYNPDGFEAEMCGNALRCSARYATDKGFFNKRTLNVETRSGIRSLTVTNDSIYAEIGIASILQNGTLDIYGATFPYFYVSMGNPHCVIFTSILTDNEFAFLGPLIETHPFFPEGANVEFANVIDERNIEIRVWERGIGETLSCVTGSCACAAAANSIGLCAESASVHQKGGVVEVEQKACGNMFVNGNAFTVFKGNYFERKSENV